MNNTTDTATEGFKAGDRVIERASLSPISADVKSVSKDGRRIQVQFWGRGMRDGKLTTQWSYAASWRRK